MTSRFEEFTWLLDIIVTDQQKLDLLQVYPEFISYVDSKTRRRFLRSQAGYVPPPTSPQLVSPNYRETTHSGRPWMTSVDDLYIDKDHYRTYAWDSDE